MSLKNPNITNQLMRKVQKQMTYLDEHNYLEKFFWKRIISFSVQYSLVVPEKPGRRVMSRYDSVYSYRLKEGRKLLEGTFRTTKTHSKIPCQVYSSPARLQNLVRHSMKSTWLRVYQDFWKNYCKGKNKPIASVHGEGYPSSEL